MKKQMLALLLLVGMLCLFFVACGSSESDILGRWESSDEYLEFFSDGTFVIGEGNEAFSGTYTIEGNRLRMDIQGDAIVCDYEISGNTLSLDVDNEIIELTRAN